MAGRGLRTAGAAGAGCSARQGWAKARDDPRRMVIQGAGGPSRRVDWSTSSQALALAEHRASQQHALPRTTADGLGAEGFSHLPHSPPPRSPWVGGLSHSNPTGTGEEQHSKKRQWLVDGDSRGEAAEGSLRSGGPGRTLTSPRKRAVEQAQKRGPVEADRFGSFRIAARCRQQWSDQSSDENVRRKLMLLGCAASTAHWRDVT